MPKLIPRTSFDGSVRGYSFYCPACDELHAFNTAGDSPLWSFDGNFESPSFLPSLRYTDGSCHLYVSSGQIHYCNDCPHEFRGKVVPLVDWDLKRWCPMSALHTVNGKPVGEQPAPQKSAEASKSGTHKETCGNVGVTGKHGALGSNAKEESAT